MAKAMRCLVGLHKWQSTWDSERAMNVKVCQACGKRVSKGWPPAPLTGQ